MNNGWKLIILAFVLALALYPFWGDQIETSGAPVAIVIPAVIFWAGVFILFTGFGKGTPKRGKGSGKL